MKKNRTMRAAALLLALTLMTSCFVGGTFAKYTTSDTAEDTARVAQWGIEVLASGNLFGTDYAKNSTDATSDRIVAATSESVSSTSGDIVAPGTKNTVGFTAAITGTPEVSYKVSAYNPGVIKDIFLGKGDWGILVKATGLNAASDVSTLYVLDGTYKLATNPYDPDETYYELHDAVSVEGDDYYPIKWTVANTASAFEGFGAVDTTGKNLIEVVALMVAGLNGKTGEAKESAKGSYVLTWDWPFEQGANDAEKLKNNKMDTILGNLFAGNADAIVVYKESSATNYGTPAEDTNYCLDIKFSFALAVEQTD